MACNINKHAIVFFEYAMSENDSSLMTVVNSQHDTPKKILKKIIYSPTAASDMMNTPHPYHERSPTLQMNEKNGIPKIIRGTPKMVPPKKRDPKKRERDYYCIVVIVVIKNH